MPRTLALTAMVGLAAVAHAQSFVPIFTSGDVVPDSGGELFNFAYDSSISSDGYVGFKVRTQTEPNSAANQGIYHGQLGNIGKLAFEGETAPGSAFAYETFNGFDKTGPVSLSARNGHFAYAAQLAIPGQADPNNVGLWRSQSGGVQKIGIVGEPAPGGSDTFGAFQSPYIDNQGRSIFFAITSTGSGIFADSVGDGSFTRAAFSGDAIAGLNTGETLNNFSFAHANSTGQWLVLTSLNGSSDKVLVAGDHNTGDVRAVLREGASISNSSQTVDSLNDIGDNQLINANGTIAFGMFGSAFRGGIVVANQQNGVRVIGERGQAIGDTGLTFNSQLTALPKLNNLDQVSFVGRINGAPASSDRAIFVTDSDLNAEIFLREGDEVPGLGSGIRFGSPPNSSSRPDHLFNDSGIVVAGISLTGSVTSADNYAIVFGTSSDDLSVLVRTGDLFSVDGIDKTIAGISYSDEIGVDGLPVAFNSLNQFIFQMDFTDNTSGIFVATVPAPGAVGLLAPALAIAARRRRH